MKTLSLAIPKTKIQPPPTRSEIIDAMTRVRMDQLATENRAEVEARKTLEAEISVEIQSFAMANLETLAKQTDWSRWSKDTSAEMKVMISDKQMPKPLKDKIKKAEGMQMRLRTYDFKEVRKEVYAAANKIVPHDERVSALLNDEASKKGLEKMLEAIL